jgi:acylphosphatase
VKVKIHKLHGNKDSTQFSVVNPTKIRAHVFITGRVQGVFFRSETRHEARRLGVSGWIQNTPEGRVEAVFEGEEKSVKEIIEFCKRGPPGARVTDIQVLWENHTGEFRDFQIRYEHL